MHIQAVKLAIHEFLLLLIFICMKYLFIIQDKVKLNQEDIYSFWKVLSYKRQLENIMVNLPCNHNSSEFWCFLLEHTDFELEFDVHRSAISFSSYKFGFVLLSCIFSKYIIPTYYYSWNFIIPFIFIVDYVQF